MNEGITLVPIDLINCYFDENGFMRVNRKNGETGVSSQDVIGNLFLFNSNDYFKYFFK